MHHRRSIEERISGKLVNELCSDRQRITDPAQRVCRWGDTRMLASITVEDCRGLLNFDQTVFVIELVCSNEQKYEIICVFLRFWCMLSCRIIILKLSLFRFVYVLIVVNTQKQQGLPSIENYPSTFEHPPSRGDWPNWKSRLVSSWASNVYSRRCSINKIVSIAWWVWAHAKFNTCSLGRASTKTMRKRYIMRWEF